MTFSGALEEMKIKLQGQDILKTYMRERLGREQYKCRLTQQTESLKFHQSIQTTRSNRIIYELLRLIFIPFTRICQSIVIRQLDNRYNAKFRLSPELPIGTVELIERFYALYISRMYVDRRVTWMRLLATIVIATRLMLLCCEHGYDYSDHILDIFAKHGMANLQMEFLLDHDDGWYAVKSHYHMVMSHAENGERTVVSGNELIKKNEKAKR